MLLAGTSGLWWLPNTRVALELIRTGCSLFAVRLMLAYLRKVDGTPSAEEVAETDPRPGVFYIRAFYQEADDFTYGPKDRIQPYIQEPVATFWGRPRSNSTWARHFRT